MLTDRSSRRALFYRQLAGLEHAGVSVRQALPKVRVAGADLARLKNYLQEAVDRGEDLGRAFAQAPELQPFERQLMGAAVKVGRLSETWTELADYFENKAQMRRELIGQLAYPTIVLHVAIFLPPVVILLTKGVEPYLWMVLPPLALLWGLLLGIPLLLRRFNGGALLDALCWHLPVVAGMYRLNVRRTALSVLRSALAAGIIADEALAMAGNACPGHGLRRQFLHAAQEARGGQPLPMLLDQLTLLPQAVRDGMATGAESGELPEAIERLEKQMAEAARIRQKVILTLAGVLAFLVAAGVVAFLAYGVVKQYVSAIGK